MSEVEAVPEDKKVVITVAGDKSLVEIKDETVEPDAEPVAETGEQDAETVEPVVVDGTVVDTKGGRKKKSMKGGKKSKKNGKSKKGGKKMGKKSQKRRR